MFLRHRRLFATGVRIYFSGSYRKYACRVSLSNNGEHFEIRKGKSEIRLSIAHNSYISDVAREFDYYLGSVVPEIEGAVKVADFSRPKLHEIPGLHRKFFFTSLPEGRSTNEAYLQAFQIKPGDVVIDAGAYCGLTTYLFSLAVGKLGKVIAIEADPQNFAALSSNLQRHHVVNALPLHAAVWKEAGHLKFSSEGNMGSAVSEMGPRKRNSIDVPAMTLMDICAQAGISDVNHVKMDIEGAEYEVILASDEFIKRFRPDFVIEAHREGANPINVEKLRRFFERHQYDMRQVQQSADEIFPLLHFTPESNATDVLQHR